MPNLQKIIYCIMDFLKDKNISDINANSVYDYIYIDIKDIITNDTVKAIIENIIEEILNKYETLKDLDLENIKDKILENKSLNQLINKHNSSTKDSVSNIVENNNNSSICLENLSGSTSNTSNTSTVIVGNSYSSIVIKNIFNKKNVITTIIVVIILLLLTYTILFFIADFKYNEEQETIDNTIKEEKNMAIDRINIEGKNYNTELLKKNINNLVKYQNFYIIKKPNFFDATSIYKTLTDEIVPYKKGKESIKDFFVTHEAIYKAFDDENKLFLTYIDLSSNGDKKREISINFKNTYLFMANFKNTILYDSVFNHELSFSQFEGSDLRGVDFSNANLNFVNFRDCDLTNAKFKGAKIIGSDFTGSVGLKKEMFLFSGIYKSKFDGNLAEKIFKDQNKLGKEKNIDNYVKQMSIIGLNALDSIKNTFTVEAKEKPYYEELFIEYANKIEKFENNDNYNNLYERFRLDAIRPIVTN